MVEVRVGVPFDALKEGDSVLFWDYRRGDNALTHHRLIQKQGDAWIVKGDNNEIVDGSWVTKDNYLAQSTGKWAYMVTPPPVKMP